MGIQERKQRERERRRQTILVAARRVLSQKPFETVTVEEIAREAELSPGTLYLYFKNKDDMCAALSLRVLQLMNVKLDHALADADRSLAEKFDALRRALLEVYDYDTLILNNLFHLQSSDTLASISPELLEEINALSRKALRRIGGMFTAEMEKGTLRAAHPTALADMVWSLFSGIVLWEESKRLINPDRYQLEQSMAAAFDLMRRGLEAVPAAAESGETG